MAEAPDPELQGQKLHRKSGGFLVEDLRIKHPSTRICNFIRPPTQRLTPAILLFHKPVSKVSLKNLELIPIRKLPLLGSTKGQYVLLRTLEASFCDRCIKSIVEDHEGNAAQLWWYNVTVDMNNDVNDILPKGMIFALKEPFSITNVEIYRIIICETPSDVVFLYEGHLLEEFTEEVTWKNIILDQMPKNTERSTAADLIKQGDNLFRTGKFHLSIRCYLMTLQKLEEFGDNERLVQIVHLKLSNAHYRRGYYETALDFAEEVLKVDITNYKALIMAARSSYKLRKFRESFDYFREYCAIYEVVGTEIEQDYMRSKKRIQEQELGHFDMCKMHAYCLQFPQRPIDCADYVGPIQIVNIEGKGRGVIATSHIAPGSLLVVSKALSYVWQSVEKGISENETWEYLAVELGEKIAKNPETFGPIIYDLYAGDEFPVEQPPRIFCDTSAKEEPIIDMQRLATIIKYNSFGRGPEHGNHKLSLKRSDIKKLGCGLFKWPSYFNHSCIPNAALIECNDLIFIRAIRYIEKGMEIYIPYLSWEIPLQFRKQFFKSRGFQCECALCIVDSKMSTEMANAQITLLYDYENIYRELTDEEVLPVRKMLIKKTLTLVKAFESTYPEGVPYYHRSALSPLYAMLSMVYELNGNHDIETEIDAHKMILKFLGFNPPDLLRAIANDEDLILPTSIFDISVFHSVSRLVLLSLCLEDKECAKKWSRILFALHNIYYGGGEDLLKIMNPDIEEFIREHSLY